MNFKFKTLLLTLSAMFIILYPSTSFANSLDEKENISFSLEDTHTYKDEIHTTLESNPDESYMQETNDESETESNLETNDESETESNLETDDESEMESNLETDDESELESNLETDDESEMESNLETDDESEMESNLETNNESETENDLEIEDTKKNNHKKKSSTKSASLKKGDRNNKIIQLKKDLNKLGFSGIKVTNYFGEFMEKRVKEFQKYFYLNSTGMVDSRTENTLKKNANTPFQRGKRHNTTVDNKKMLNKLGFGHIKTTNLFGSFNEKKVKEFQKYFGLKQNGLIDDRTLNTLKKNANTPFQRGKRHSETVKNKEMLNKLGFGHIKTTNLFGSFNEKQVKEFQKYFGLKQNGLIDDKTLSTLRKNANTRLQRGKRHNDIKTFKTILNSNGYGQIKVTTLYGEFMKKRVTKFQKDNKLVANGIIDSVTENALNKLNEKIRIFIDPGHGGRDPGASGYGLKEKDITLDIALRLKRELERKYSNVEVMMARTDDSFVELEDRAKMANEWNADYFISLHNNSFSNSSASGFESYIHNSNSANSESAKYQNIIHDELIKNTNMKNRGKKSANFSVLRNTKMPAMLIEYLFISNPSDNKNLSSANFRQRLASLTANGLAKAFDLK